MDYALSEKWMQLWKWFVRLTIILVASIVVILMFPVLGALIMFAAAIGTAVISIIELVYIYRMMSAFRTYASSLTA